jgi:hypothetical protein
MEVSGGWQFWLEDHGRVRQFMVAEADEIKARKVLREKLQNEKILSRKMVPRDIIQMLNMKPDANDWITNKFPIWLEELNKAWNRPRP